VADRDAGFTYQQTLHWIRDTACVDDINYAACIVCGDAIAAEAYYPSGD
jgi:hypothetical protein